MEKKKRGSVGRPKTFQEETGRFNLELPRSQIKYLQRRSKKEGLSMSSLVRKAIEILMAAESS